MVDRELHIISNGKQSLTTFTAIAKQIHPYATALHIREKHRSTEELSKWLASLVGVGVPRKKLVINSHIDLAMTMGAGGVHLPGDVPFAGNKKRSLRIGRSVHTVEEVKRAKNADYLFFGHVYETASKPGARGKGIVALKEIVDATSLPVIAIGGIDPAHVPEILQAGAAGVAVMSGVVEARDPVNKVSAYLKALTGGDVHETGH